MTLRHLPTLQRHQTADVVTWIDPVLRDNGVLIAFSERGGGCSGSPFSTLNLASHVGDDPHDVDENRRRLMDAHGLGELSDDLVMSQQVHGVVLAEVTAADAGWGARAEEGRSAVTQTDALMTASPRLPLLLCFADCVPLIIVAPGPRIAVVHAGWRGALGGIARSSASTLASSAGCSPSELSVYIGPHIGACHYEVDGSTMSQFVHSFGTVARAESGGLDLGSAVAVSLTSAGVDPCKIATLGTCTAETIDRFFSYRAEAGRTGRHGALACIL